MFLGRKLILNLPGSSADGGRKGTEEDGEDDLNSGQSTHPGNRVSRFNAILWNLNCYLMSCRDEWNVKCPWFWQSVLFAVFGFSGLGTQMLTNLYPRELCFGSSYIVLIHAPFVCAYCPHHISFSWGQTHFPLLYGFMCICLRLCLQKDKGIWYFFIAFFCFDVHSKWLATSTLC